MKLQILILIFLCCVYYVFGETSFIPKGQRAEIFELTDNEIPVFRITLSNDEYNLLKRKASFMDSDYIKKVNRFIREIIEIINGQNIIKIFPGYNFNDILPELPINENGYPNIDYREFHIDFDDLQYIDFANLKKSFYNIFNKNQYLDLISVFHTLNNLDVSSDTDKTFMGLIKEFGTEDETVFDNLEEFYEKNINIPINEDYFGYYYNYNIINDNYDSPSSGLYNDSPSSGLNYDLPNSIVDDTEPPFNFISFFHRFLNGLSRSDFDSNYINDDSVNVVNSINDKVVIDFDKFNTKDFYEYFKNYDFDKKKDDNKSSFSGEENEFKTKNATLIVEINNEKKIFDKITFSLGGSYSRNFAKPGYNLKIRGKDELYGRRQFKLRGDASEPSYMRTKLVSDIRNRIGMPSLSANYATLYINDEYLGLFILTDIYKESWIEYVYGEKDTQLLYKCNLCNLNYQSRSFFENENKEATNKNELYEFLAEMTKAESASDVETIFDLDQYYKEIAVDVLVSSWDHTGHNYYIYKNKENNKWIYLSHDYDLDMGRDEGPSMSLDYLKMYSSTIRKLIPNDDPRFRETIKEIVTNVFNPAIIYPHIDEIKTFIKPYVEIEKTPDENGQYPGRLNKFATDFYTFKQWEDSVEFKSLINGENNDIYALKKFILLKYRIICQEYELECDPVYLDRYYGRTLNVTDDSLDESNGNEVQNGIDFEN